MTIYPSRLRSEHGLLSGGLFHFLEASVLVQFSADGGFNPRAGLIYSVHVLLDAINDI